MWKLCREVKTVGRWGTVGGEDSGEVGDCGRWGTVGGGGLWEVGGCGRWETVGGGGLGGSGIENWGVLS